MKITIQLIVALILIAGCSASVVSILVESYNYDNYYWQGRSAILDPSSNDTQVISISVTRDTSSGNILLQVDVSASNPSNYQGFTLRGFDLSVSFFRSGNIYDSIFWQPNQLLLNTVLDSPLSPGKTISAGLQLSLDSTQSSTYQMFNQTAGGIVEARCVLLTKVNSFLDPVYGVMTTIIQRDLPVS